MLPTEKYLFFTGFYSSWLKNLALFPMPVLSSALSCREQSITAPDPATLA
jgi:hypothetical protein